MNVDPSNQEQRRGSQMDDGHDDPVDRFFDIMYGSKRARPAPNKGSEVELRLRLPEEQIAGLLGLLNRLDDDFFGRYVLRDGEPDAFAGLSALRRILGDHVHAVVAPANAKDEEI